jgi:hypothetical protein
MKRLLAAMLAVSCLAAPAAGSASWFPEIVTPHDCRKPYKPYKFTSEYELQSFKDDVAKYKRCIEQYVQGQEDAIDEHRRQAKAAIDDWNRYVQYDLR